MPSPDENHQFHLVVGCLGLLVTGAHSLYKCPSGTTQSLLLRASLWLRLMAVSYHRVQFLFFFAQNLLITNLTMATEVNERRDCPVGKPLTFFCKTRH